MTCENDHLTSFIRRTKSSPQLSSGRSCGSMPHLCAAFNCGRSKAKNSTISFFRFPSEATRCKRWVINTRRGDLDKKTTEEIHKNNILCSAHFEESQFTNKSRNKLNWNAIPTLFNIPNPPAQLGCKRKLSRRFSITDKEADVKAKRNRSLHEPPKMLEITPMTSLATEDDMTLKNETTTKVEKVSSVVPTSSTKVSLVTPVSSTVGKVSLVTPPSLMVEKISLVTPPSLTVGKVSSVTPVSSTVGKVSLVTPPSLTMGKVSSVAPMSSTVGKVSLVTPSLTVGKVSLVTPPSLTVGKVSSVTPMSSTVGKVSLVTPPFLTVGKVSSVTPMSSTVGKVSLVTPPSLTRPASSTDTMFCSAINCSNSRKKKPQLSFFRFPKDEERCWEWVRICRRQDLVGKTTAYVSENCRLCANHFEETQFMNYQKRDSLVWNAVPTLFNFSSPPKRLKFRCRPPLPRKQDLMSKTSKMAKVVAQNQKKKIAEDLYACASMELESEQLHSSDLDHSISPEAKRAKISVTESPGNVPTRITCQEAVKSLMTNFSQRLMAGSTDSQKIISPKVPFKLDEDEMVNFCAGLNCRNTREKCPGMKFLRFPKDQARSNVWVQQTRRLDLRGKSAEYLHRTAVLCETHFDDKQWLNTDQKSLGLIPKAVPTLFDVPFPPMRMPVKRRKEARRVADDGGQTEIGDMEHDHCYASFAYPAYDSDQTVGRCCVLNCPNEAKTGLRLYPFPADKTLLRKWIAYCGREPGWTPGSLSKLCGLHFESNQFIGGGDGGDEGWPLKPDAIPNRHYLSIPLTTGQKLRLLLDQAASQDRFIRSVRNSLDDLELADRPESPDHSETVASATCVDSPEETLNVPKKGSASASEPRLELSSMEKTELAIDLCKNLIAEMLLSTTELFLERVGLINRLRDAWASGRSVCLSLGDANQGSQAADTEAKTSDAEPETIPTNRNCNNQSEVSGIGQTSICDPARSAGEPVQQADEQELYLNIECDVITEESDCESGTKRSDEICEEIMEKYEQASADFGKYVARVLVSHDCRCPMKSKELSELVGIVWKKFMMMEVELKRRTTEAAAAAVQSHPVNDRCEEYSSTNSMSNMLGRFFNGFDGYWPEPAQNVNRSDESLVTKESPSTVHGVIRVGADDVSHESNEGKCEETVEKEKRIHGKKAAVVRRPRKSKASRAGVIYQCIDCREIFRDKASCQVHAAAGCVAVQSKEPANRIKGGLLYECPVCHKTFSVFSKMIEHLPVHTKPFLCQLCGQRFAQADLFAEHKSTCTAVRQTPLKSASTNKACKSTGPVLCSTCGKQFLRKSSLYYHMRRHMGKPHHMCSFCGKLFYVNAVLVQHLRIHTGEKPYLCPQCPQRFGTTGLLQRHLRVHTGERPYTCDICQRTFAQSNSLKTHRLTHSTEKPHSCLHCERAFRKRSSLIMHMRAHTKDRRPVTCKTCGKIFATRARLATHEIIHTGRRPPKNYECAKCHRKFDTDRGLERHVTVVHSGQTPNKAVACDVCHQRFFTTARLERHKELHHGKESTENEAAARGDSSFSLVNSVKGGDASLVVDWSPDCGGT